MDVYRGYGMQVHRHAGIHAYMLACWHGGVSMQVCMRVCARWAWRYRGVEVCRRECGMEVCRDRGVEGSRHAGAWVCMPRRGHGGIERAGVYA